MRLILAVVGRDDLATLLVALSRGGYTATVFHQAMSFLPTGAGLMIGVPEEQVPDVIAIIRLICRTRPRPALPLVPGLAGLIPQDQAGGALCVVLKVARWVQIKG